MLLLFQIDNDMIFENTPGEDATQNGETDQTL